MSKYLPGGQVVSAGEHEALPANEKVFAAQGWHDQDCDEPVAAFKVLMGQGVHADWPVLAL